MKSEITDKTEVQDPQLIISNETEKYLRSSAKWSYFLAIVGFIFILFLMVIGVTFIGLSSVMNEYSDFQKLPFPFPFVLIGVLYLLMAILYFFPSYNLLKFGSKIQSGLAEKKQSDIEEGLKNLKRMFTFIGVLTIISIFLSILIIPIILIIQNTMIH